MPLYLYRSAVLPALVALAGVCPAAAVTVDIPVAADTSIFSPYPDNDFGASTLESGTNGVGAPGRALFRFDLSSIPANAVITGVQLTLSVVKVPPGDQHAGAVDSDFGLYRMLVGWSEGNGGGQSGAPAEIGDPTWNEREFGIAPWRTPGGQIGTDFANTASTSTPIGSSLSLYAWGSTPQFVSDVQSWVDDPSTNFGFIMISDQENAAGTARRFGSRENPGGGIAPATLTVTYSFVPEPGPGFLLGIGALFGGRKFWRRRSIEGKQPAVPTSK